MAGGRPTLFSQELADSICERIATSEDSLHKICTDENMPHRLTVNRWLKENKEFCNQYARAKEEQMDYMAQRILEISDDSSQDTTTIVKNDQIIEIENKEWVNRSKLKVDTRKWLMGKLAPKKYGEKVDIKQTSVNYNAELSQEDIKKLSDELDSEV